MKAFTVKIHDKKVMEEVIPADSFAAIQTLYSIFGIKVELIKEQKISYEQPKNTRSRNKRKHS